MRWVVAAALVLLCCADLRAEVGVVRILDGDTIVVGVKRFRLSGIDAPELLQSCDGWPAGRRAAGFLAGLMLGRSISCEPVGVDLYGRILAVCRADGRDLGADMVRAGMAYAFVRYSRAYIGEEQLAREEGLGVHAHSCVKPWDYRRDHAPH